MMPEQSGWEREGQVKEGRGGGKGRVDHASGQDCVDGMAADSRRRKDGWMDGWMKGRSIQGSTVSAEPNGREGRGGRRIGLSGCNREDATPQRGPEASLAPLGNACSHGCSRGFCA
eukprot:365595-Chlamydomonas_euryale.AAC.19